MLRMEYKPLRALGMKWLLAVAMLAMVGCAGGPRMTDDQKSALEDRARARWAALEARDFGAAYEFTTPAYRAVFPREYYLLRFSYAVEWELTEIEVVNYDRPAAVASVVARVMSKPTKQTSAASVAVGATARSLSERWIFTEGEWWYSTNY